jgi:ClpP class serine protease
MHKSSYNLLSKDSSNEIAIIYAQGEIMGGEGDVTVIGEGSMRRSLQEARNTKSNCFTNRQSRRKRTNI